MDLDLDQIVKFMERKAAEIEVFWNAAEEFVTNAVDVNTDLFQNTVDQIRSGLNDLADEAADAGGDSDNTDVDVEAELRDVLDN